MRKIFLSLFALTSMMCFSNQLDYITIVNNTGFNIHRVYISPTTSAFWGQNQLDTRFSIADNEEFRFTLPEPLRVISTYDIRLIDLDVDSYTRMNVQVSAGSRIVFTFGDFDIHNVTQPPVEQGVVVNGVRWATRNVDTPGTFAQNPESFGRLYQWNRRSAWNVRYSTVLGWNSSTPTGTSWTFLNDPCPPGWRVPTRAELQRLVDAGSTWTTRNGVNGRLFGAAPNQIFLPAAGY